MNKHRCLINDNNFKIIKVYNNVSNLSTSSYLVECKDCGKLFLFKKNTMNDNSEENYYIQVKDDKQAQLIIKRPSKAFFLPQIKYTDEGIVYINRKANIISGISILLLSLLSIFFILSVFLFKQNKNYEIVIQEKNEGSIVLSLSNHSQNIIEYNWNNEGFSAQETYSITEPGIYTLIVRFEDMQESELFQIEIDELDFFYPPQDGDDQNNPSNNGDIIPPTQEEDNEANQNNSSNNDSNNNNLIPPTTQPTLPVTPEKPTTPKKKKFVLNVVGNGATVGKTTISCETINESCQVFLPNITRKGWQILGFNEDSSATTAKYKINERITLTANKTVYAITTKKVNVTFDKNSAENISKTFESCNIYNTNNGCKIISPTVTREGWNILGFSDNSSSKTVKYKVNSEMTINSNIKLYAITSKTYTATFNGNGATFSQNKNEERQTCNIYNNETKCNIIVPIFYREGWIKLGYSTDKNTSMPDVYENENLPLTGDEVFYALSKKTYTVTFDANGAEIKDSNKQTCTAYNSNEGCSISTPLITRSGWEVLGFNKNDSATTAQYKHNEKVTITENSKLYAITKKEYTATFNGNGATFSGNKKEVKQTCNIYNNETKCNITSPIFYREGWTKLGYSTDKNTSMPDIYEDKSLSLSGNEVFYALSEKTFKVTIDANGATSLSSNTEECKVYNLNTGCRVILPNITRENGEVLGFNTSSSATTAQHKANEKITITKDMKLYAITKKTITVTFAGVDDIIGDNVKTCEAYNTKNNCSIRVPNANVKGNVFWAFKRDSSLTANYFFGSLVNFSNRIIYPFIDKDYKYYRNVDVSESSLYSNVYYERDSACTSTIDYEGFVKKVNSQWPFILKNNGKIMILNKSLYQSLHSGSMGVTVFANSNYTFIDFKCGEKVGVLMHEIGHMYDRYYGNKNGTRLSSLTEFKQLYEKYKISQETADWNDDYSNQSEFFATTIASYYIWYFYDFKLEGQARFQCDLKDFIENKILVPNGVSKPYGATCLES